MASLTKRNGKWQYRVSYKDLDGKFRTKAKGGFATKKQASLASAKMESILLSGNLTNQNILFKDYMRSWFEVFRKGKRSKANDDDIRRACDFVDRYFPNTKLSQLKRIDYQKALNKYGENHATASVLKHHTYMKTCIQEAIQEGLVTVDPTFKAIVKGKVPPKDEKLKYINYGDAQKLIVALENNIKPEYTSRYIILFGLATGCRFSEIIGLTWDCVCWDKKEVVINKTWDQHYTNTFSTTKNKSSVRTIPIDDQTIDRLKTLRKYQLTIKRPNINNLVFTGDFFEPVTNNAVNKTLRKFCRQVGVREITCHSLRHTHASILLYKGVEPKYVSERLGHSQVTTTTETYQHIIEEARKKESSLVQNTIEELFCTDFAQSK